MTDSADRGRGEDVAAIINKEKRVIVRFMRGSVHEFPYGGVTNAVRFAAAQSLSTL
jgi:hypothetical protein